ncbi:MAG: 2-amino-4-hydroxy-6-hydroxymethyldihydropteridine diphosphokinase [Bacteroidaceae bacterium]|nr:2-amino-4-hydroxy-6-hydroxymethyldihydropteridine diphosphokinase [Bacteroidaceae bacterium]
MNQHFCLFCLGSNFNRDFHMEDARKALREFFPTIRFSEEMTTDAIGNKFLSPFSNQVAKAETSLTIKEIRYLLKKVEKDNGRLLEDKELGIVKLDIDLLKYDDLILKPNDMEKDYVLKGISSLQP